MEQNKREQFIIRRIGGTTYKVRVAFSETAAETKVAVHDLKEAIMLDEDGDDDA